MALTWLDTRCHSKATGLAVLSLRQLTATKCPLRTGEESSRCHTLLSRWLPICKPHEIPSLPGYTCKRENVAPTGTSCQHPNLASGYTLPLSATALPCGSVAEAHPPSSPLARALGASLTARPRPSLPEGGGRSVMGLCALCLGLQERREAVLATWRTASAQQQAGCSCQSIKGIGHRALPWLPYL